VKTSAICSGTQNHYYARGVILGSWLDDLLKTTRQVTDTVKTVIDAGTTIVGTFRQTPTQKAQNAEYQVMTGQMPTPVSNVAGGFSSNKAMTFYFIGGIVLIGGAMLLTMRK